MTAPLYVRGGGAVTAVGLDRPQTCAGIRARMARFEMTLRTTPFGAEQAVARIPVHWQMRRTWQEWLAHMAGRVVREVMDAHALDPTHTALVVVPPELFRLTMFMEGTDPTQATAAWVQRIEVTLGVTFVTRRWAVQGGAAALSQGLDFAHQLLEEPSVHAVLLVAADSYVQESEFTRLDAAGRLRTPRKAQGLTPGEGAACLLLAATPSQTPVQRAGVGDEPQARLLGWAYVHEARSALSEAHSQGAAWIEAMNLAAQRAGTTEPAFAWTVSNDNGERYAAWEASLARARYFRSRRPRLQTLLPAMSVGEIGAAGGPLAILAGAHRFLHAGRGTRHAMVELASEAGGRAACVLAPLAEPSW
jgi:3-oxoacyl-[acyl-carrier-protein] synthase I